MASSTQNTRTGPTGFGFRSCQRGCWRTCKWLPVLLIASIVAWSYYAYVVQLCVLTVENTIQQVLYLVFYHIILVLFLWSYWQTIFAVAKPIPDKYKLPQTELEKILSAESEEAQRLILENYAKDLPVFTRLFLNLKKALTAVGFSENKKQILEKCANTIPVLTRTMSGSVRYCNRCVLVKPDRSHHCSICSRCILKMDHHCPWVNNCVCFYNYKFFLLFLGYSLMYCLFVMTTSMPFFIKFWRGEYGSFTGSGRYHIVFVFCVSLMFAISLGSLFVYHCYLTVNNRTTLEAFRAPMFRGGSDKEGFSLGTYRNFKEVFGNKPNLWFVPLFTSLGDGCEFPVRREHQLQTFTTNQDPHGYESMGTTRSSFGDGLVYPLPVEDEDTESLLSAERWAGRGPHYDDDRDNSSLDEL